MVQRWWVAVVLAGALAAGAATGGAEEEEPVATKKPVLQDLAWMAGTWVEAEGESVFTEVFSPPQGDAMVGHDHWTVRGVTRMLELIAVEQTEQGLVMRLRHFGRGLVPSPAEKDGPLEFPLERVEGQKAVFRHPTRAWPRSITYERTGDELLGRLEGVEDGQPNVIPFHFRRR